MTLTDDDAQQLLPTILATLQKQGADEVLAGIDESRRLGIEELLPEEKHSDLKQVARTRRRPPNNAEMLAIVIERLQQRLVVLPAIARSIEKRLGSSDVLWRVDTEFSSVDRFPEASLQDLLPKDVERVADRFNQITRQISPESPTGA